MTRAAYGEGSLYQRRSDWRWIGAIYHGYTPSGERRRHTVSGKGCVGGCRPACAHVAEIHVKLQALRESLAQR